MESVNGTGVDEAQQHDIPSRTRDIVEPKKKTLGTKMAISIIHGQTERKIEV